MKTILLYATSGFFILSASSAHEVVMSPAATTHKTIVERRIVQANEKLGAMCTTSYVTVLTDGVKGATRKSVDCEE